MYIKVSKFISILRHLDFVDKKALCKAFQLGVVNPHCSLDFVICLFFNEIDAEVLDGTRLSRVPRVRGVNLHVLKAGGLGVHRAEHLFIVDEDFDLGFPVFYLLRHSDLGPLVKDTRNCPEKVMKIIH